MKKNLFWLAALPLAFTLSCTSDNKQEKSDNEALTKTDPVTEEGGDPAARAQEYEHSPAGERADTLKPEANDTTGNNH